MNNELSPTMQAYLEAQKAKQPEKPKEVNIKEKYPDVSPLMQTYLENKLNGKK